MKTAMGIATNNLAASGDKLLPSHRFSRSCLTTFGISLNIEI
jgi:hypothetical protein